MKRAALAALLLDAAEEIDGDELVRRFVEEFDAEEIE